MLKNSFEIIFLADEISESISMIELIKSKVKQVEDVIGKIDDNTPTVIQEALFNFLALLKTKEIELENVSEQILLN
ncbi:MAG: hypothetical protein HGA27_04095 [Peptococcaceae bacterium]|nr:hypothetical protein [Peptococcaceae bacterium]